MAGIRIGDLNNKQLDVIKEMGNIGAGNAVTALSKMLNKRVEMTVPKIKILDFKEIPEILGDPELLIVGILLQMSGDMTGSIMFILNIEASCTMVDVLMGRPEGTKNGYDFDEIEISALKETGNILAGSYLSALSTLLNLDISPSTPELCVDMAGAILSVPAVAFGNYGEKALYIENRFTDGKSIIEGEFFLIPDVESYEILLHSLGVTD